MESDGAVLHSLLLLVVLVRSGRRRGSGRIGRRGSHRRRVLMLHRRLVRLLRLLILIRMALLLLLRLPVRLREGARRGLRVEIVAHLRGRGRKGRGGAAGARDFFFVFSKNDPCLTAKEKKPTKNLKTKPKLSLLFHLAPAAIIKARASARAALAALAFIASRERGDEEVLVVNAVVVVVSSLLPLPPCCCEEEEEEVEARRRPEKTPPPLPPSSSSDQRHIV